MSQIQEHNQKQTPLTREQLDQLLQKITPQDAVKNFENLVNRCLKAGAFSSTEEVMSYDRCVQVLKKCVEDSGQPKEDAKSKITLAD